VPALEILGDIASGDDAQTQVKIKMCNYLLILGTSNDIVIKVVEHVTLVSHSSFWNSESNWCILSHISTNLTTSFQVLINSGALRCLKALLTQSDKVILEKAFSVIANIAGGDSAEKQVRNDLALLYLVMIFLSSSFLLTVCWKC
jgi:hypothetical protein